MMESAYRLQINKNNVLRKETILTVRSDFTKNYHILKKFKVIIQKTAVKKTIWCTDGTKNRKGTGREVYGGNRHGNVSYLSPEIQNEFINCLGNHVRKKILAEVKEAKYFTIVFDITPDLSHKDQTSQILRYVKLDDTKVQVMESFIDFLETEGKKAKVSRQLIQMLSMLRAVTIL
ncbi:hypothetical protein RN001_005262 [Aquatica leii]|uniref:DUF4371 domain-containing protein n=1 Tax=Aquatica leii TaxID=1421715 RepID=A0AAN7QK83_9COLE|nr:hypothetical protein RN001_005262 [Aquatica leii]